MEMVDVWAGRGGDVGLPRVVVDQDVHCDIVESFWIVYKKKRLSLPSSSHHHHPTTSSSFSTPLIHTSLL
jgi:hypothetical protein